MASFDCRITVVCFLASWVGSTGLVSLLVFSTRKPLTKSEQWAKGTAAHCAFTSCRLPHKGLQGKLKDGALAHLLAFSLFFLSPLSRMEKEVLKHYQSFWRGLRTKATATVRHTDWNGATVAAVCLNISWRIQIGRRGDSSGRGLLFCAVFRSHFFTVVSGLAVTRRFAALLVSTGATMRRSQAKINATHCI